MIRRVVLAGGAAMLAAGAAAAVAPPDRPDLASAADVLVAGGGPATFKTMTLLSALTDGNAGDALAALVRAFGVPAVKTSVEILDFIVVDAQRRLADRHLALPPLPDAGAVDIKALRATLVDAARTHARGEDFGTLLDRLLSHPVRVAIEHDVTVKFGTAATATFTRAANAQLARFAHGDGA